MTLQDDFFPVVEIPLFSFCFNVTWIHYFGWRGFACWHHVLIEGNRCITHWWICGQVMSEVRNQCCVWEKWRRATKCTLCCWPGVSQVNGSSGRRAIRAQQSVKSHDSNVFPLKHWMKVNCALYFMMYMFHCDDCWAEDVYGFSSSCDDTIRKEMDMNEKMTKEISDDFCSIPELQRWSLHVQRVILSPSWYCVEHFWYGSLHWPYVSPDESQFRLHCCTSPLGSEICRPMLLFGNCKQMFTHLSRQMTRNQKGIQLTERLWDWSCCSYKHQGCCSNWSPDSKLHSMNRHNNASIRLKGKEKINDQENR